MGLSGKDCDVGGFEGWDYEELAHKWGIETDAEKLIKNYIFESMYSAYDDDGVYIGEHLDVAVKADMMEFLRAIIRNNEKYTYGNTVFVGLLLVAEEDDWTFAQYFCQLLPMLWV